MIYKVLLLVLMNFMNTEKNSHINDFKWSNRLLLVIDNPDIKISNLMKEYANSFKEREFVIIFIKDKIISIDGEKVSNKMTKSIFKKIQTIDLDKHKFILIGKDGGIKNTYPRNRKIVDIFSDVDKMPMRQYEVHQRKK